MYRKLTAALATALAIVTASAASATEPFGDTGFTSAIARHGNSDVMIAFAQARHVTPRRSLAQGNSVNNRRRSVSSSHYIYDGVRRIGADPDPAVRDMIARDLEGRGGGF